LENGSIDSFELLMRWKSNILGDVSPGEFIPAAESNDLIIPIGYMAIEMACDFIKLFNGRFKISVNISTIQLKDLSFTAKMLDILNTKGVSPSNFILEITESSVLSTDQSTKGILEKWDNLGMTLAMDDFGTGYSSLGNMLTFSFKKIKVDKSLIDHLDEKMPQNLIKSIVNFAKSINISVVAEGVEDNKTLELVKSAGFCYLQGYFESKPLVIDDLIEYVKRKDK
jgi:EAL domain-containing protein (putative c-di-GMP-specific phosphodiesterase class I)